MPSRTKWILPSIEALNNEEKRFFKNREEIVRTGVKGVEIKEQVSRVCRIRVKVMSKGRGHVRIKPYWQTSYNVQEESIMFYKIKKDKWRC